MGVTIHYRLSQNKGNVKRTLDRAEKVAEGMKETHKETSFKIKRYSERELYIDIGGCETLAFDFRTDKEWEERAEGGWNYEYATLKDYKYFKEEENALWTSGFCKTQFAEDLKEHKMVADLIRVVAGYCDFAEVNDEGDYYHSGDMDDAEKAIKENGALIDSVTGKLKELGYKEENIIKGETKIK